MIYRVVTNQRRAATALGAKSFGKYVYDAIKLFARKISIRPGSADQLNQIILIPISCGSCGDDLLGQDVQRPFGNRQSIKLTAIDAAQQRRAFDQLIASQRKNAAFRQAAALVLGATDALQQCGDGTRAAQLANEIHGTDINPQFQRSGGHERL